jgi:hypothetical protein
LQQLHQINSTDIGYLQVQKPGGCPGTVLLAQISREGSLSGNILIERGLDRRAHNRDIGIPIYVSMDGAWKAVLFTWRRKKRQGG